MTESENKDPAAKLRALQAQYLIHLSEKAKALESFRHTPVDGLVTGQMLDALRSMAHQLAGGGSIYGYPSITDAAQNLERFLDVWQGGKTADIAHKLELLYTACKAAIESGPTIDSVVATQIEEKMQEKKLPVVAAIDDDPMLCLVYKTLLEGRVRLIIGSNANDAQAIMREHKPALVLLDDIMPGGPTGLSFLESIKDDPELSRIPIIMVTASNKKEDVLRGLAAGAIDYIIKPFIPEDLIRAVTNALSRKEHKIVMCLEDHHLADALMERMEPLNCRVIDAGRECKSPKECINHEHCLVLLDHRPVNDDDLRELALSYPETYFVTIGDRCADLNLGIEKTRHIHMPQNTRPEEIVYNMGHMIGTIKKAKAAQGL